MNQDWIIKYIEEILQHENYSDNTCDQHSVIADIKSTNRNVNFQKKLDGEDEWGEDEVEILAGVTDTRLTSTSFLEAPECQNILKVNCTS